MSWYRWSWKSMSWSPSSGSPWHPSSDWQRAPPPPQKQGSTHLLLRKSNWTARKFRLRRRCVFGILNHFNRCCIKHVILKGNSAQKVALVGIFSVIFTAIMIIMTNNINICARYFGVLKHNCNPSVQFSPRHHCLDHLCVTGHFCGPWNGLFR